MFLDNPRAIKWQKPVKTKRIEDNIAEDSPSKKRKVEALGEVLETAGFDSTTYQRIVHDNQVFVFAR
jgi:hypothetical protein